MQSMAMSEASNESKLTKPKPLLSPVFWSRLIFGCRMRVPKAETVSYSRDSSTSFGSRFPTKMFAPTSLESSVLLVREDLLTRMGLPNSLIILRTVMA